MGQADDGLAARHRSPHRQLRGTSSGLSANSRGVWQGSDLKNSPRGKFEGSKMGAFCKYLLHSVSRSILSPG
jgi:hypothetical protein